MKIRGLVTGALRDPDEPESRRHKVFIDLDTKDGAAGRLTVPIPADLYEKFSKNAVHGPFEVEVHLNFDKPAPT